MTRGFAVLFWACLVLYALMVSALLCLLLRCLANVDTAGVMGDMLAGLRAAKYRVEYAEGVPADALTPPSPDEISPVSAFS